MLMICVMYKPSVAFMNFQVEYYGSPVSLKSIAQISTPDASSLLVQPYDKSRYSMCQLAELNVFRNRFEYIGWCTLRHYMTSLFPNSYSFRIGIKQYMVDVMMTLYHEALKLKICRIFLDPLSISKL